MPEIEYQRCTRCVMDTSDPDIIFNKEGHCNHCEEFLGKRMLHKYQGAVSDKAFERLIKKIKKSGKGKKYDCVIGLSGGIDSSYAAYIIKKSGLRPLAVHLDNGWDSEEAVKNIKNVTEKLGIDYESYVLNWEDFKYLQLAFLKASVPEIETPTDIAIPASWHIVAAKYDIKYVISGGNFTTEGILPKCWHYNAKDLKYLKTINHKFSKKKLNSFPTFGFFNEMYYKLIKGIRIAYPLNYVPYDPQQAVQFLQKELAWEYYGGKHYESKYTGFVHSYLLYEKFNIDYRLATFSSEICVGNISREDALKELKNKPYEPEKIEEEKKFIAKKLDISIHELEYIIHATPKLYRDYPNDEIKLNFIYNVYRRLFKKEKLANF